MAKQSSKASFLPVIFSIIALLASVGIYIYTRSIAHAFALHLLGYALTPLVVALCMGWDTIAQRKGLGSDPWYEKNPRYSLILRILTAVSFLAAFPHIFAMAVDIAEKLSGQ